VPEIREYFILNTSGNPADEPILSPPQTIEVLRYGLPSSPESLADRVAVARLKARRFLQGASRESVAASGRLIRELQQRTGRMKDENPMALLGIIAGSAFLLGVTLRIWRSRH
jgi:hypothetical protein